MHRLRRRVAFGIAVQVCVIAVRMCALRIMQAIASLKSTNPKQWPTASDGEAEGHEDVMTFPQNWSGDKLEEACSHALDTKT
jgi:hypothetical protein